MINLGVIVLELGMCYSKLGEIHPTILLEGLKRGFTPPKKMKIICLYV